MSAWGRLVAFTPESWEAPPSNPTSSVLTPSTRKVPVLIPGPWPVKYQSRKIPKYQNTSIETSTSTETSTKTNMSTNVSTFWLTQETPLLQPQVDTNHQKSELKLAREWHHQSTVNRRRNWIWFSYVLECLRCGVDYTLVYISSNGSVFDLSFVFCKTSDGNFKPL